MTVNDPSTPETAPGGPQERPEGGSATPAPPESLSGPQKGAESLRLWDRMLQAVRDTPAGYPDDIAAAVWLVVEPELRVTTALHNSAETDVSRVIRLAEQWAARPERADALRELTDALGYSQPANNTGPTVAECAAQDRRWWNGEKAGE